MWTSVNPFELSEKCNSMSSSDLCSVSGKMKYITMRLKKAKQYFVEPRKNNNFHTTFYWIPFKYTQLHRSLYKIGWLRVVLTIDQYCNTFLLQLMPPNNDLLWLIHREMIETFKENKSKMSTIEIVKQSARSSNLLQWIQFAVEYIWQAINAKFCCKLQ